MDCPEFDFDDDDLCVACRFESEFGEDLTAAYSHLVDALRTKRSRKHYGDRTTSLVNDALTHLESVLDQFYVVDDDSICECGNPDCTYNP